MTGILFPQEKWSRDSRMISKFRQGNYTAQPSIIYNYVNPNRSTKVYYTAYGTFSVSPNFRVLPDSNQQNESIIFRNPANPLIMFGSANTTIGYLYSQGVYVSTNGGITWLGNDTLGGLLNSFSDPGPVIDKNGTFILTTLNTDASDAIVQAYRSTNLGINWSNPINISTVNSDKNLANTDDVSSSPYYGRSYCVWSNFAMTQPAAVISYTSNSGASWTPLAQIDNPPSGHYAQGCDVVTGPNGEVYVCWAGANMTSPFTEDFLGFAKSLNGGANWTVTESAYNMHGIRGILFPTAVRVNGFPRIGVDKSGGARNGWIYIVTAETNLSPAGNDPDIILHRSTDVGSSWSAGVRVNQDAINNGKYQFFPAIRVDEFGGVNIVYYDNRNCSSDSCEVFVSRSIDGGNNWTDILISDSRWKPMPEYGFTNGYMGDYIGITSGAGKLWPFWFDNRTSIFQVWTSSLDLGPFIIHTPLTSTETTSGSRTVNCIINTFGSAVDPSNTKLIYSKDNPSFTDSVLMTNSGGNNWTASLTLSGGGLYRYYLKTADMLSRIATAPGGAPKFYYSFIAGPDTIKPVIVHTPIIEIARNLWPDSITAYVTDNIGVDSVWVKWYRNNTSSGINRFNLHNAGGSVYNGIFNSDSNQVFYNDSIFYRIFARDISSNHNVDSTVLFTFKIRAYAVACIGNGLLTVGYPFYTFYMDSRTDLLYLAGEIKAGGGSPGGLLRIAFTVASPSNQVMNGFKIKVQNTTATSISSFTNSGWTTVANRNFTILGSGLQLITLDTPYFSWNGTSNLLFEICFNNNSYAPNSTVYATAASGMAVHNHQDLPNGDGCTDITTPGSGYTARPNICIITSQNPIGIRNIESSVPSDYSLYQNYPNPFNPVTQIKFDIPKKEFIKLIVYDVLGREIATLLNETKLPGSYIVDFDGSNLSSGVYFYKLEAGTFSAVKRMILIK